MNKDLLNLILAQLAADFPDTAKTYSAEVFADWLADLSKQYMEAFNTPQRNSTITAEFRRGGLRPIGSFQTEVCHRRDLHGEFLASLKAQGLSPTGRRPSQPELQSFPSAPLKYGDFLEFGQPLVPLTDTEIEVVKQRAKELLQQYRDTFPVISAPWLAPGHYPNFPCVAVDLASGVDYSVAPKWETVMDKTPRPVGANPLLAAPYGNRYNKEMSGPTFRATLEEVRQQTWGSMTPDDIYKDISGMLLRQQADEEYNRRAVENGLQQEWVHLLDGRVSSYVPADQAGGAVFSTGRFEDGHMFVETMDKGEKAVTLARAYLLRLVKLELKS